MIGCKNSLLYSLSCSFWSLFAFGSTSFSVILLSKEEVCGFAYEGSVYSCDPALAFCMQVNIIYYLILNVFSNSEQSPSIFSYNSSLAGEMAVSAVQFCLEFLNCNKMRIEHKLIEISQIIYVYTYAYIYLGKKVN